MPDGAWTSTPIHGHEDADHSFDYASSVPSVGDSSFSEMYHSIYGSDSDASVSSLDL